MLMGIKQISHHPLYCWKILLTTLCVSLLPNRFMNLYFPKFSISGSYEISNTLRKMGIVDVFTNQADLSGITGTPDLKVSKVSLFSSFTNMQENPSVVASRNTRYIQFSASQLVCSCVTQASACKFTKGDWILVTQEIRLDCCMSVFYQEWYWPRLLGSIWNMKEASTLYFSMKTTNAPRHSTTCPSHPGDSDLEAQTHNYRWSFYPSSSILDFRFP